MPDPVEPDAVPEAQQLADALAAQDSAAVAFALRNGIVIVPLLPDAELAQVRVFRAPGSELHTMLLFSSAGNYVRMVPKEDDHRIVPYDRAQLQELLEKHLDSLDAVWFDVAGPHPMKADPSELLAALAL